MARAACRILLSRGSDLSHLRHWTPGRGRILRRESLSRRLRGAGRTPGLWLAWQFGGPHHGIPATGACRSLPQSFGHRLGIVWTSFVCSGLSLWGNGRAAFGKCLRLASLCCLIPGSRESRCVPHHRAVDEATRQAQGSCPSGHVDRASRGDAGGVTELVSSPQRSIAFGMRGDVAPHPPLLAIVFRTLVV